MILKALFSNLSNSFAMQCNAMQCNAMQCNAMQCNAMQCNAMQCNAMQCNAMQCNAMQCNAMQCNCIHPFKGNYIVVWVGIVYKMAKSIYKIHLNRIKNIIKYNIGNSMSLTNFIEVSYKIEIRKNRTYNHWLMPIHTLFM